MNSHPHMSTTATPTPEQITKVASEVRTTKQIGFCQHMLAAGKSQERVKAAHAKYTELDGKREARIQQNYEGIRAAVLGK